MSQDVDIPLRHARLGSRVRVDSRHSTSAKFRHVVTQWGFQKPINGVSGQSLMGLWWRVQCSVSVFCNSKYRV